MLPHISPPMILRTLFAPSVEVIAACCVLPGHGQSIRHGDELTHDTMDPAE